AECAAQVDQPAHLRRRRFRAAAQLTTQPDGRAKDDPTGKLAALGQHSSGLDQFLREVDAVDPAAVAVRKVSRWPADTTANVENPAVLRNCDALSLMASSSQTPRVEML